MTLNHVHLGTRNLQKFIEFYSSLFGFRKKFDHGTGAFLANDAGFLIAVDPVDELPHLPEWYHLGFCLSSEAEALAMHERCVSSGVDIVRELRHEPGDFASFFVRDPDRNKIEISWHRE